MNYTELKYDIHEYYDFQHNICKELLIHIIAEHMYDSRKIFINPYFVNISNNNISIRVPIYNLSLNYYLSNYKDYVYIPQEKICIPKALAGGLDKSQIQNATKETCKISVDGEFIPTFMNSNFKLYKESASASGNYILLSELNTKEALKQYVSVLLNNIIK